MTPSTPDTLPVATKAIKLKKVKLTKSETKAIEKFLRKRYLESRCLITKGKGKRPKTTLQYTIDSVDSAVLGLKTGDVIEGQVELTFKSVRRVKTS